MNAVLWILVLAPYVSAAIAFAERKRILRAISDYVTDAVYQMLQDQLKMWLVDDRDKTVQVLRPLMKDLVNDLIKEYQKNGTAAAPGELTVKLPFIGKVPVSVLMSILGKSPATQKVVEEANPFA